LAVLLVKTAFFFSSIVQMETTNKSTNIYYIIATLLIVADQVTKFLVKGFPFFGINYKGMQLGESFEVIGDFVKFTFVENPGMAFGISFGWGKIFLSLFSVLASIGLAIIIKKISFTHTVIRIGTMLIFAGATGNLIDRCFYGVIFGENPLFYGYVVDFIEVNIPDVNVFGYQYTSWPVFNIADSCVFVGVILMMIFNAKIPSLQELKQGYYTPQIEKTDAVNTEGSTSQTNPSGNE
jgi:signal peptidase II